MSCAIKRANFREPVCPVSVCPYVRVFVRVSAGYFHFIESYILLSKLLETTYHAYKCFNTTIRTVTTVSIRYICKLTLAQKT